MSKHTPGPWALWPGHMTIFAVFEDTEITSSSVRGFRSEICELSDDFDVSLQFDDDDDAEEDPDERWRLNEEGEATARLIVAAPDLLSALEALVPSEHACPPRARLEVDAARAAIAKARGER